MSSGDTVDHLTSMPSHSCQQGARTAQQPAPLKRAGKPRAIASGGSDFPQPDAGDGQGPPSKRDDYRAPRGGVGGGGRARREITRAEITVGVHAPAMRAAVARVEDGELDAATRGQGRCPGRSPLKIEGAFCQRNGPGR